MGRGPVRPWPIPDYTSTEAEFEVIENDSPRFRCSVRRVYETVYDQMGEGICLPCAMATVSTIAYRLKYGILLDFSPQSLINNGITRIQDAIDHMADKDWGIQEHCDDPFVHIRCNPLRQSGHRYTLDNCKLIWDEVEMINAIKFNFGPWGPKLALIVGVDDADIKRFKKQDALAAWNGDEPYRIQDKEGGDGDDDSEDDDSEDDDSEDDGDDSSEDDNSDKEDDGTDKVPYCGHAMVITGLDTSSLYEDQHVIEIRNSHGNGWGWKGHSRVTYDFIKSPLLIPLINGDAEDMEERHHQLQLNTFIGDDKSVKDKCFSYEHCLAADTVEWHPVLINDICFSDDGTLLAAVCEDRSVRILHLHDALSKSFKCQKLLAPIDFGTLPIPVAVAFGDNDSSVVVACKSEVTGGTSISTYDKDTSDGGDDGPLFSFKCHSNQSPQHPHSVTLYGAKAYGAHGSTILATSSTGTDILGGTRTWGEKSLWLGNGDAIISPDGQYIAAATSEHSVKVWMIERLKDTSALEKVEELRVLEGHEDAVTSMCFTPAMEIISASLDGTLRVWNIEGQNPLKAWKTFPLPRQNSKETQLHYDCVAISPDGDILAASQGKVLQWLSFRTGKVIDTAEHAHKGIIRKITWAPKPFGDDCINILATVCDEKKLKLWKAPALP